MKTYFNLLHFCNNPWKWKKLFWAEQKFCWFKFSLTVHIFETSKFKFHYIFLSNEICSKLLWILYCSIKYIIQTDIVYHLSSRNSMNVEFKFYYESITYLKTHTNTNVGLDKTTFSGSFYVVVWCVYNNAI